MPKKQRRWVFVSSCCAVFFAITACESDEPAKTRKETSLTLCVDRWWREPVAGACGCSGRAECGAADCESFEILRLGSDGSFQSGVVTRSASAGALGVVGTMAAGTYAKEGDGYRFAPDDGMPYAVTQSDCSEERLVLNQIVRVPTDESTASQIDQALAESR